MAMPLAADSYPQARSPKGGVLLHHPADAEAFDASFRRAKGTACRASCSG